ncbi:MAG: hypothetical protein ACLTJN_02015 [Monoglobus pectinilyticus]
MYSMQDGSAAHKLTTIKKRIGRLFQPIRWLRTELWNSSQEGSYR